jgi:hypothetical protein
LISRLKNAAASDAERREQGCYAFDDAALRDQLNQAKDSERRRRKNHSPLSACDCISGQAGFAARDKSVIRLPEIASMPQKGARQQTRSQSLSPIAMVGVNDDYRHRMLENALASAVLAVLVISGIWIVSILAAVP